MGIKEKLKSKIKEDCDIDIHNDAIFIRRSLSWNNKTAGSFKWFWMLENGIVVGSAENMKELLKSPKILYSRSSHGNYELSSN